MSKTENERQKLRASAPAWAAFLPDGASSRLALAARVASIAALLAYFVAIMSYRLAGAASEYALQGDQHQSIGQYWRYSVEGAMPPGHLISDYAFAYHATPLWWLVMASLSSFLTPLLAAKVMNIVVYFLLALAAALVVGRRTHWLLGCLTAALVLRSPDLASQVTGGMARSIGPALFLFFLWAFYERRHRLVLVILVLQAATYPSVVIPCGITYGVYCLVAGPMAARRRRCAEMFVAGLLVLALGKAQDAKAPDEWGSVVSYAEAAEMQAWRKGGRFHEVPHKPFLALMGGNVERAYKQLGDTPIPKPVRAFIDDHTRTLLLALPALVALLAILVGFLKRRREGASRNDDSARFPWEHLALFAGTIAAYWLVRAVSFKLFLPSRQLGFTVQFLVVTGLPMLCWYGAQALFPRRGKLALALAALLAVAPAFLFRGDGLAVAGERYRDFVKHGTLFDAVKELPLDEEIACDAHFCEYMMVLGMHSPYAAWNLTHPVRPGYFAEAHRRYLAMHQLLYATSPAQIQTFVKEEGVRFLAYRTDSVERFMTKKYRPATKKLEAMFKKSARKTRLLADPPAEVIVFRDGSRLIVDLSKWP